MFFLIMQWNNKLAYFRYNLFSFLPFYLAFLIWNTERIERRVIWTF